MKLGETREKFSASSCGKTSGKQRCLAILSVNGGLSPRQENFARLFETHGWCVRTIVWDRGGGRAAAWAHSFRPETRIVVPAPVASARILFSLPRYLSGVRKALRAMEAGDDPPAAILATHLFHLLVARRCRAFWIYDACEYFSLDLARYFGPFATFAERLIGFWEGRLGRHAAAVLAVDSREDWLMRRFGRRGRPVKAVWNVPARNDEPSAEAVALAAEAYRGKIVLAYAGSIAGHKGIEILLEAFARVVCGNPDVILLLIGPVADPEKLHSRIAALDISRHVIVREPMGYSALLAHLSHASIGMALFQEEYRSAFFGTANSRKIFTYMQAGLAVVTTGRFDLGTAVRDSECGVLVNAADAGEVARALIGLLKNPDVLEKMRLNARRAFETEWNWERVAPDVWAFLVRAGLPDFDPA